MDYTRIQVPRWGVYHAPVNVFKAVLYVACVVVIVLGVWWLIDTGTDNNLRVIN